MEENKTSNGVSVLAIISYIGPLCLIPFFTKEKDDFVKFHAKQGLVLFILEVIVYVVLRMLPFFWYMWNLMNIISLAWLVFGIVGIINVVNKRKKPLPIIGSLADKIKL
jgi:fumarate reductase subunit D